MEIVLRRRHSHWSPISAVKRLLSFVPENYGRHKAKQLDRKIEFHEKTGRYLKRLLIEEHIINTKSYVIDSRVVSLTSWFNIYTVPLFIKIANKVALIFICFTVDMATFPQRHLLQTAYHVGL